jgi:hypothetical protein
MKPESFGSWFRDRLFAIFHPGQMITTCRQQSLEILALYSKNEDLRVRLTITQESEPRSITAAREAVRRFVVEGVCPNVTSTDTDCFWMCSECRCDMPPTKRYDTRVGEWVVQKIHCGLLRKRSQENH